jgi:transcriptional regulator of acetoin/glycerol metabolism
LNTRNSFNCRFYKNIQRGAFLVMFSLPSSISQYLDKANLNVDQEHIFKVWESFMLKMSKDEPGELISKNQMIRPMILESWKRSEQYGINPLSKGSGKNYSSNIIKELSKNDRILNLARPVLDQLNAKLAETGHVIFLSNSEGIILHTSGDRWMIKKIGNSINAATGADWSEKWAGTNAIGTSITLKEPIHIFSAEHFTKGCHDWVCSSVPIMNPFSGEVLSTLTISTLSKGNNNEGSLSMALALWGATSIEKLITIDDYQAKEMVNNVFLHAVTKYKNHPIFVLDLNNNILLCNDAALRLNFQKDKFNKSPLNQKSDKYCTEEWEIEVPIQDQLYQVYVKELSWRENKIGRLVVLTPKSNEKKLPFSKQAKYSFSHIIGEDPILQQALLLAKKAASSDANILITGESGTGKELLASAIHKASSRADQPFIAINCGAFSKELISSELFGYVGGAFTGANSKGSKGKFELANNGTLFLDEIGETSLEFQIQLLRAIQEQEIIPVGGTEKIPINVRIIAATNKDLTEEIKKGSFRKDLFFRIKVFEIELPALRKRKEDIQQLCEHFINKYSVKRGKGPFVLTDSALQMLQKYNWPGNIRELENAMEYAVNVSEYGKILPMDLPKEIASNEFSQESDLTPVEKSELNWILEVLQKTNMNFSLASKELNMNRSTIYRKLKKYGFDIKQKRVIEF